MSGFTQDYETTEEVRSKAAQLLDCSEEHMIEVVSPDGGTTYCYASQADADNDQDGAYAVQYHDVGEDLTDDEVTSLDS